MRRPGPQFPRGVDVAHALKDRIVASTAAICGGITLGVGTFGDAWLPLIVGVVLIVLAFGSLVWRARRPL